MLDFWESSIDEIKNGYKEDEKYVYCIICGLAFEKDIIFKNSDEYLGAVAACKNHIENEHGGVAKYLLSFSKKEIGLSEIQKKVFEQFILGKSDKIIAENLNKSISTIRNHRFILKEKARQSKAFLTLMSFLLENEKEDPFKIHRGAKMVDERFMITKKDIDNTIKNFIKDGRLVSFPSKEKKKIIILKYIMKKIEIGRKYSEKEINDIIKLVYYDDATIRRYFIEYGFMKRTRDCSTYWVNM